MYNQKIPGEFWLCCAGSNGFWKNAGLYSSNNAYSKWEKTKNGGREKQWGLSNNGIDCGAEQGIGQSNPWIVQANMQNAEIWINSIIWNGWTTQKEGENWN